jgi:prepilin-type N-terminal cleavage/methylation domain-containing protein
MNNKGFTLIELLIVVAIIGVLAAFALPKFQDAREKSYMAAMKNDLRNMVAAQETFFDRDDNTRGVYVFSKTSQSYDFLATDYAKAVEIAETADWNLLTDATFAPALDALYDAISFRVSPDVQIVVVPSITVTEGLEHQAKGYVALAKHRRAQDKMCSVTINSGPLGTLAARDQVVQCGLNDSGLDVTDYVQIP